MSRWTQEIEYRCPYCGEKDLGGINSDDDITEMSCMFCGRKIVPADVKFGKRYYHNIYEHFGLSKDEFEARLAV